MRVICGVQFCCPTTYIMTTQMCQFQKDSDDQVRCKLNIGIFMSQCEKDRDEQA